MTLCGSVPKVTLQCEVHFNTSTTPLLMYSKNCRVLYPFLLSILVSRFDTLFYSRRTGPGLIQHYSSHDICYTWSSIMSRGSCFVIWHVN